MIPSVLDDVTIWQGDSRELLARLPDASVDLICTDPPYNLGGYSTGNIKMAWRSWFNKDVAEWGQGAFDPSEWLGGGLGGPQPPRTHFSVPRVKILWRLV